ncbi:hypothetical protein [Runella sp.]|uniref:hypothetical protein n=1 Tax=Runella sp. TaxID=1960881 RepID=UPI003D14999D
MLRFSEAYWYLLAVDGVFHHQFLQRLRFSEAYWYLLAVDGVFTANFYKGCASPKLIGICWPLMVFFTADLFQPLSILPIINI